MHKKLNNYLKLGGSKKPSIVSCVVFLLLAFLLGASSIVPAQADTPLLSPAMEGASIAPALSALDFSFQENGDFKLKLHLSCCVTSPKVFKTNNPSRIALDFPGVKNDLTKKSFAVNKEGVRNIYVAESNDKTRVVINLNNALLSKTETIGNDVFLTLSRDPVESLTRFPGVLSAESVASIKSPLNNISALIPPQAISGFDFNRGEKGEGRIKVSLKNPNTVVSSKEENGKVIISFSNTRLPSDLAKRLDVSEFATPVRFIDATTVNNETVLSIVPQNELFDYSVTQSNGLLTIEFRQLNVSEKEALDRSRSKYTGKRLSLNFQDIEIRNVISVLSEFTGQNVVAGDDVVGTITVKLDDVPWDEALDFIMMTKQLGKYETGNMTLISPLDKIKEYKQKQQETNIAVDQLDVLVTEYIKINYAKAEDFRSLLYGRDSKAFGSCGAASATGTTGSASSPSSAPVTTGAAGAGVAYSLVSPRGSVTVDARTNTIIVHDTPKHLDDVKKLIKRLDIPVRQVMIESRIVIASSTFAQTLGVQFGAQKMGGSSSLGGATSYTGTGNSTISNSTGGLPINNTTATPNPVTDQLVNLAAANPYGALGLTLASGADYVLNLELSALQDQGLGELISNPRVMTTDRCKASIKQGYEVPYQSSSANAGTNIQFKEALLQLDVIPQITPDGRIIMTLKITKDYPEATASGGAPAINTRSLDTNVQVFDGETVVLGGVFEGTQQNAVSKVPFFADLPGIGYLFKRTVTQDDKKELLIFVTPKIVKEDVSY